MISRNVKKVYSLQLKSKQKFQSNLSLLEGKLSNLEEGSIACVPELFLTNVDYYPRMKESADFSVFATERLLKATVNKTLVISMIECDSGKYFNVLKVFHNGEIVHQQRKSRLFTANDEHLHFESGTDEEVKIFRIGDIPCAALICFELRFVSLWLRVRGAKIIFVPAMWGKRRKTHFEVLCRALAIANQCFVVASSSANTHLARGSSIVAPYGVVFKNDSGDTIFAEVDISESDKMMEHIDVGIRGLCID